MRTVTTFSVYKGTASCRFTCSCCGLPNRTRTFTVEQTVNPYNKGSDGFPKGPAQVAQDAREAAQLERKRFLTVPLCRKCEDELSYQARIEVYDRRKANAS